MQNVTASWFSKESRLAAQLRRLACLSTGLLVTAACGGCLVSGPIPPAGAQTPATATPAAKVKAAAPGELDMAVVDFRQLVKNHPDYEKLKQMEQHIAEMEQEKEVLPLSERRTAQIEARKKMQAEYNKAMGELRNEKAAIDSQLRGLASSLGSQMQAEGMRMKADADAKLKAMIGKLSPETASPLDRGPQSPQEYGGNLGLLRSQALMARRLELEKVMSTSVTAERARLDSELGKYEDSVRGKYQQDLVNLNLKLRMAKDDEEQKATEASVHKIQDEIDKAKNAKRTELDASFKTYYADQKAKFDADFGAYGRKVDDEVQVKVGGRPRETAPVASHGAPRAPRAEIQAKIKELEAQMNSEMQAKQAQLKSRMEGEQKVAMGRLMAKQTEVKARLKVVSDQLQEALNNREKFMSKDTLAKLAKLEKNLEKAKDERKQLFKSMEADIDKAVGTVANKQSVSMVLGEVYYHKPDMVDLTDLSMVTVKQLGSR